MSSSSHNPTVPWTKDEIERLIDWMEDNPEELRGKQAAWHRKIVDKIFNTAKDKHIDVKKICDKATNMKKQWRDTSAFRTKSGWGLQEDNLERTIHEALEKKCPYFFRLDAIWGTRPGATARVHIDSQTEVPEMDPPPSQSTESPSPPPPSAAATQTSYDLRDMDDFEGTSTQSSTPRTSTERARSTSQASSSQASSRRTSSTQ